MFKWILIFKLLFSSSECNGAPGTCSPLLGTRSSDFLPSSEGLSLRFPLGRLSVAALVRLVCGEGGGELARASGPGRRGDDGVAGGDGILRVWYGFLGGRGLFLGFLFVMRRGRRDREAKKMMNQVIMGKSRQRGTKEGRGSRYLSAIVEEIEVVWFGRFKKSCNRELES